MAAQKSPNVCLMLVVVLLVCLSEIDFLFFKKFCRFFMTIFLGVFFSDRLASNYVLWLKGRSKNNKELLNANCCVSLPFF